MIARCGWHLGRHGLKLVVYRCSPCFALCYLLPLAVVIPQVPFGDLHDISPQTADRPAGTAFIELLVYLEQFCDARLPVKG